MRNATVALLVLLAGVAGFSIRAVLWDRCPDLGAPPREDPRSRPELAAVAPTLAPTSPPDPVSAPVPATPTGDRIEALVAEVRRLREDLTSRIDALSRRIAAQGEVQVRGPAWAYVEDEAAEVDRVRAAWTRALDEADRFATEYERVSGDARFRETAQQVGPRARAALAEAATLDDLRRLSEGEFKSTFVWPKR